MAIPLDAAAVVKCAEATGHIVTVEDHNVIGGLGTAVAEVLAEAGTGRLTRHGVENTFGESGKPADLYRKYKLDAEGIASVVKEAMGK